MTPSPPDSLPSMSLDSTPPAGLSVGYVPGVTLAKWRRVWAERYREPLTVTEVDAARQLDGVRNGHLDLCFVRLPIDRTSLHCIPLYEEQVVAWVSKDNAIAAVDEVTMGDLSDETVLTELDAVALDRVLAGAVLIVPMSIARGASRRDLTYRPIVDADPVPVGLAWRVDNDNPLIDDFVGVVRGRTVNSSRGAGASDATRGAGASGRAGAKKPARKRSTAPPPISRASKRRGTGRTR